MPIITSIKSQKNKKRVNVYLDNKFGFGIDLDNFVLLHLKVDQELTNEQVDGIVKKAEFQKTLDKLLMWATLRPRSEKEIKDYFKRKKVHESLHKELFQKLDHFKLVNDEEFAKWWIEQRLSFRSKSVRDITQELRIKGISKQTIEKVIVDAKIDELKIAKELIKKKSYKWQGLDQKTQKFKVTRYLAGKGFSWSVIEKATSK